MGDRPLDRRALFRALPPHLAPDCVVAGLRGRRTGRRIDGVWAVDMAMSRPWIGQRVHRRGGTPNETWQYRPPTDSDLSWFEELA
jgi:hypothetical protein